MIKTKLQILDCRPITLFIGFVKFCWIVVPKLGTSSILYKVDQLIVAVALLDFIKNNIKNGKNSYEKNFVFKKIILIT